MPRCDTCMAMQPSVEVRKLPRRDAYRCKDKFACMLRETNRDAWRVTFTVTYPAKNRAEAEDIANGLQIAPFPLEVVSVERDEATGEAAHAVDAEGRYHQRLAQDVARTFLS